LNGCIFIKTKLVLSSPIKIFYTLQDNIFMMMILTLRS